MTAKSRVRFESDDEGSPAVHVASYDPFASSEDEDGDGVHTEIDNDTRDRVDSRKNGQSGFYLDGVNEGEEKEYRKNEMSEEDRTRINRMLNGKSYSAPSSPMPSPKTFPGHRPSDIPLMELNRANQANKNGPRSIDRSPKMMPDAPRSSVDSQFGRKEADRIVKEHVRNKTWPNLFHRFSLSERRSGIATPAGEDQEKGKGLFNSGVLSSLLKLYSTLNIG
jgi:hypothetical protein